MLAETFAKGTILLGDTTRMRLLFKNTEKILIQKAKNLIAVSQAIKSGIEEMYTKKQTDICETRQAELNPKGTKYESGVEETTTIGSRITPGETESIPMGTKSSDKDIDNRAIVKTLTRSYIYTNEG